MKQLTMNKVMGLVKSMFLFCLFTFLPFNVAAQEQLLVADAFQFTVRMDYTADGMNGITRPYQSRFGVEGWTNHMALALVMTSDIEMAKIRNQKYSAPQEAVAAATPALSVVYMITPEGYQNVTFFSGDKSYAYVLYFSPESSRSWLLVSRVGDGVIQPLYQLSNDSAMLPDSQLSESLRAQTAENVVANVDAFVSLVGRLASGQYAGINYIEK